MNNLFTNIGKIFLLIYHFYFYSCIKSNQNQTLNNFYHRHLDSTPENSVTLVVNGPGENIDILGSNFNLLPDEILINDSPTEIKKKLI